MLTSARGNSAKPLQLGLHHKPPSPLDGAYLLFERVKASALGREEEEMKLFFAKPLRLALLREELQMLPLPKEA